MCVKSPFRAEGAQKKDMEGVSLGGKGINKARGRDPAIVVK